MNEADHRNHSVREIQPLYYYSSDEDMQPLRIRRRRSCVATLENIHGKEEDVQVQPVEEELRPLRRLRLRGFSRKRVKALYLKMRRNGAFPYEGDDGEECCCGEDSDLGYFSPDVDEEWFSDDIDWSDFSDEESETQMHEDEHQHHLVDEMQPLYEYSSEEDLEPLRIQRRRVASSPSQNLHDKEEEPSPVEELRSLRKLRLRASLSHKRVKALFLKMRRNGAFSYKKSRGKGSRSKSHSCDAALPDTGADKAFKGKYTSGMEEEPILQIVEPEFSDSSFDNDELSDGSPENDGELIFDTVGWSYVPGEESKPQV